jgi:hypothetical protein
MKARTSFVSNSSSSSFVIMNAGEHFILESGDTEAEYDTNSSSFPIDDIIAKLLEAKKSGATTVLVTHGGGFDGGGYDG